MVLIEKDQRWAQVRRLVKGDGGDTGTRVAGLLLLFFAQPLSRISRIRLDQVARTVGGVTLTLGSHPIDLPPPLDFLVLELVQQRYSYSTLGRSEDHPWLFPGTAGGQPISSRQLMRRLTALGIKARPARNTTLTRDVPRKSPPSEPTTLPRFLADTARPSLLTADAPTICRPGKASDPVMRQVDPGQKG